jgi:uncharacterized protein
VRLVLILSLLAVPALADDGGGTLNPEEMTINRVLSDIAAGNITMMGCAAGYGMTKKGDHVDARKVFGACAARGYTGAMTWMSQLDNNGLGAPEDAAAAAEWDRLAAEAGDPVGLLNHGLDLMRGRGLPADEAAGRALVDRAAAAGVSDAQRLQAAGYDLDEVTPDADDWKYGKRLY